MGGSAGMAAVAMRLNDVSTNGVHSMLNHFHQAPHRSSSVCTPRSGT